ncbi:MAG: hypothetical protein IJ322_03950 [Clostridia bacterium]|nr:hypothetical protein [Clostridia bacterium]
MNEDIFMGTKQASELWKETQEKIAAWCRNGNIVPQPTQDKPGSPWRIRKDAKVNYTGNYILHLLKEVNQYDKKDFYSNNTTYFSYFYFTLHVFQ